MSAIAGTVKAGKRIHRLLGVYEYPDYSKPDGLTENGNPAYPHTHLLALAACHLTLPVEGIGDHGEITCGNCKRTR